MRATGVLTEGLPDSYCTQAATAPKGTRLSPSVQTIVEEKVDAEHAHLIAEATLQDKELLHVCHEHRVNGLILCPSVSDLFPYRVTGSSDQLFVFAVIVRRHCVFARVSPAHHPQARLGIRKSQPRYLRHGHREGLGRAARGLPNVPSRNVPIVEHPSRKHADIQRRC